MSTLRNENADVMVKVVEIIHSAFNNRILLKSFEQLRFLLFGGVFVLCFSYVKPSLVHFLLGFSVSVMGEAIQLWSFSCLRKNSILATRGPYALTRNPMYLGRFFLLLGLLMLFENLWLIFAYMVGYFFYMVNRVKREEGVLRNIFGNEYEQYCAKVNRFMPSFRGVSLRSLSGFRTKWLIKNNGHLNALLIVLVYAVFYFEAFILD